MLVECLANTRPSGESVIHTRSSGGSMTHFRSSEDNVAHTGPSEESVAHARPSASGHVSNCNHKRSVSKKQQHVITGGNFSCRNYRIEGLPLIQSYNLSCSEH